MLFLIAVSFCFHAAVGCGRGSDAAWSGGPQPELSQQSPWPHSCLPRQRPAAGKWTHSVLVCLPVFPHWFPSHSACCWHLYCPGAGWFMHALLVTLSSSVLLSFFTLLPLSPLLLSDLSCVQSVVVGMPPVSQVSMMEEQQRQNNMVRLAVAS